MGGNPDDLAANGVLDQLHGVVDVELAHQVPLVRLDGLDAQVQVRRDLLNRLSFGEKLEDFLLARRQPAARCWTLPIHGFFRISGLAAEDRGGAVEVARPRSNF